MTKSHDNYSLRAACPIKISWISNFTKSWFGVFDMQRSWRPKDNAVNNLKPTSRFEENRSLLVDDLPTDRGRSHWMCELVHLLGSIGKGPTQAPVSLDQTCTTSHWYSNAKNKWQSKHSRYFLQTTGQRIAFCQKAFPALNPVPSSRTVTNKISHRQWLPALEQHWWHQQYPTQNK